MYRYGKMYKCMFAHVRSDGHTHFFYVSSDLDYLIIAGCRNFTSFYDAQRHWNTRVRHNSLLPSKLDNQLNEFSLNFVQRCKKEYHNMLCQKMLLTGDF